MKFEVPYNDEHFKSQNQLNFQLVWKEHAKNRESLIGYTIGLSLLGILFLLLKVEIPGYISLGIGIHFGLNFYYDWRNLQKARAAFTQNLEQLSQEWLSSPQIHHWEFLEEEFRYSDHQMDLKVKWSKFKGFRVIEHTLFLYQEEPENGASHFLHSQEVGAESFEKIVTFLEKKLGEQ